MTLLHPRPVQPAVLVAPLEPADIAVAAALLSEGIAFTPEVMARILEARAASGTLPTLFGARGAPGGPLLGAGLLDPLRPVAGGRLFARVAVTLPARGQGIASALARALSQTLPPGALPLSIEVDLQDVHAQAVATRWGAVAYQRSLSLELDLTGEVAVPQPAGPPGVTIEPLSEQCPERCWQDAFAVYAEAAMDLPDRAGAPAPSYDMFRAQTDDEPGVHLARLHGVPVGLIGAGPDGPDTWYLFFTGTVPSVRRSGVARALKVALHADARARGVRRLTTSTLDVNEPMLRLNSSLGYRVAGGIVRLQLG